MTRRTGTGVKRWRAWLGAGAVSAAIAAAMMGGAAVAAADTDSSSGGESSASSQSPAHDSARADKTDKPDSRKKSDDAPKATAEDRDETTSKPTKDAAAENGSAVDATDDDTPSQHRSPPRSRTAPARRSVAVAHESGDDTAAVEQAASRRGDEATTTLTQPPTEAAATQRTRKPTSLLGLVSAALFNTLTAAERAVTGPPRLPPNSRVTVRSSSLQVADGISVPANWYYPDGDEPPERMILLQHGFLAIGPMYSYTAAALAERTHSVVVTPTLTSNPLADGAMWLGGNGMHRAVADLFVGDRRALTASAVAAGYADRYGLDPATTALPEKFALVGHSLGGGLVSGTAGYLADNGAAEDLVGVILLDGVPRDGQLSSALTKLDAYEQATGHFVPVREIGAPWNLWNSTSHVNSELPQARPGRYVGVVLRGGVHMDGMRGGNPLIQFAAYLAAGFPQPQNPPAVIELGVAWLDDWFAGRTDIGDDLLPGSTIVIPTPGGPARGVVIGHAVAPAVVPGRSLIRAA